MWNLCSGVMATVLLQDASRATLCASSGVSSRVRAEGVYYSRCKWWAWCALLLRALLLRLLLLLRCRCCCCAAATVATLCSSSCAALHECDTLDCPDSTSLWLRVNRVG